MSENQEIKLKRRVQKIVITAMSLFFLLVTVVVFQFAIRMNQKSTEASLRSSNKNLTDQINRAKADEEYFGSEQFKYDFALRYLNRGRPGDKLFT